MNTTKRKQIKKIIKALNDIKTELDVLKIEEEESLERIPWSLQSSAKGDNIQNCVYAIDESSDKIQEIIESLIEL